MLVAAHMDEIGIMPLYKEEVSGYLRFTNIGGLSSSTLIGNRVQFEDGTIGVIGAHARSNGKSTDQHPPANWEDFFVDISGAESEIRPRATGRILARDDDARRLHHRQSAG